MTTLYALIDYDGVLLDENLTLAEAAQSVLTSDGREYEIREADGGGFWLWTRHQTAGEKWTQTVCYSAADDRAVAEAEIYQQVVNAEWRGHDEAITMDAWRERCAEIEADA